MTIRPIELQALLPRTMEMGKVQQNAQDSQEASQNLLSAQYQQQLLVAKQKVIQKNKSEQVKYETHKEKSSKKRGKRKALRPKNNSPGSKKQPRRRAGKGHIDIIV